MMSLIRVGSIGTLIFALTLSSGCSFLFVDGPPAKHAEMPIFECSDSYAWPVVDVIWAVLNGLGAATVEPTNPQKDQVRIVGVSWLVVSGISGIHGFSKVSACKDAKRERDERYYYYGITPRNRAPVVDESTETPAAPPTATPPAAPAPPPAAAPPVMAPQPAPPAARAPSPPPAPSSGSGAAQPAIPPPPQTGSTSGRGTSLGHF